MLCNGCRNSIIEGYETWGFHHLCSQKEECSFCSVLRNDLEQFLGMGAAELDQPFYRWTLKESGRIRESLEFVSVTFRPVAPLLKASGKQSGKDVILPTKSFYLVEQGKLRVAELKQELFLEGSLLAARSLAQIRTWLRQCEEKHQKRCGVPKTPAWAPRRLVSIGKGPDDRVHLLETAKGAFVKEQYVTLSHCWGYPDRVLKSTPDNIRHFTDPNIGIDWDILPRNFQDAITLARELGVRYIWIDALCIVQDGVEFLVEAQMMHLVYRNSFCNLAAVGSKDSDGGFFPPASSTKVSTETVASFRSEVLGGKSWHILPYDLWEEQLLKKVLYTRGWVFQERMLSPRLLHFSGTQVFWDCATLSACETLPDGLPDRLDTTAATERHWRERLQILTASKPLNTNPSGSVTFSGAADDSIETFWARAVRNYTACNLTSFQDRMAAIWGIAKLVRDQMRYDSGEEEYGVGLWTTNLHEQLAWKVVDPTVSQRPDELLQYPSWSWASLIGKIDVADRFSHSDRYRHVSNHDGGPICFGVENDRDESLEGQPGNSSDLQPVLKGNKLAITGNPMEARIKRGPSGSKFTSWESYDCGKWTLSLVPSEETGLLATSRAEFDVFFDTTLRSEEYEKNFHLLVLAASISDQDFPGFEEENQRSLVYGVGLILQQAELRDNDLRQFQRMGSFRFQGMSKDTYDELDPKDGVKILLS